MNSLFKSHFKGKQKSIKKQKIMIGLLLMMEY